MLSLYYNDEMNLKEIGAIIGVAVTGESNSHQGSRQIARPGRVLGISWVMFGKKSKLQRVKADARADYLKCAALDPEDRLHRVFSARIAQRARLNLDKIFVQGAKAEEKRQLELAEAIKAGADLPPKIVHEATTNCRGFRRCCLLGA